MGRTKFTRSLAALLALLTMFGLLPIGVFADELKAIEEGKDTGYTVRSLSEMKDILDTIPYSSYLEKYADAPEAKKSVTVNLADYNKELTEAKVEVYTDYEGKDGKSLYLPDVGTVTWSVKIPETGMYAAVLEYYPVDAKSTSIERSLYIDGKIPFSEARYLTMTKVWQDNYLGEFGVFATDNAGNDVRPTKSQDPEWRIYEFCDSTGFYIDSFSFYLTEGEHTISFEPVREPMVVSTLKFVPVKEVRVPTYEEYVADLKAKGAAEVAATVTPVKVDAEKPVYVSEQVIYPLSDRTSAISDPQDASVLRLNTIGGSKWSTVGQWIRYEVEVPESGFYNIAMRFKQSLLTGMYTSRRIKINGSVPFQEASYLQFNYDSNWQSSLLNDGAQEFMFYLEKGKNVIEFEASLGHVATTLRDVDQVLDDLNAAYLKILMITGAAPDEYRDYGFSRLIPDTIKSLAHSADKLFEVSEQLTEVIGQKGQHVATLDTVAILVERMASDEDEIAANLESLKTYLGTLGTWLYNSQRQYLEMDYFVIQPVGENTIKANANFFEAGWFEIKSFVMSFFTDYNSVGSVAGSEDGESHNVVMWTSAGRDQAQILRNLIDYDFTAKSGIGVDLKLVAGGLLQSVLAGVGPDVAFLGSEDTINWAIRTAVIPLDDMEGFDEVQSWFTESAKIPTRLYYDDGSYETYGLPTTQDFYMMFYRMDIFSDLGIEVPRTWDDLYAILPVLQNNNMEIAFPSHLAGTSLLLHQMGGDLYADNGKRINLDSNVGLSAFEMLLDMFEKYRFPLTYNFSTRFRTGELPIGIVQYTAYNTLSVYASELRGMWEMVPLPGYKMEDGTVNNYSTSTIDCIVMPRGVDEVKKADAWELMRWYVSAPTQASYGTELVAILGSAAKYHTANIAALAELPWTAEEYRALEAQMYNLKSIPNYPGGYITARYVQFAFLDVYNTTVANSGSSTGADPVEALLSYIVDINKELSRKRKEFGMDYYEISYSTNFTEAVED